MLINQMQFCECGGIVVSKDGKHVCRSCGKKHAERAETKITTKPKKEEITVIEDNKPDRLPTTEKPCPKCSNPRAYWWVIQTRSSDEPPTRFYRCTNEKCKHTWREYK